MALVLNPITGENEEDGIPASPSTLVDPAAPPESAPIIPDTMTAVPLGSGAGAGAPPPVPTAPLGSPGNPSTVTIAQPPRPAWESSHSEQRRVQGPKSKAAEGAL